MVRIGGRTRLSAYLCSRLDDELKVQLHLTVLDPLFTHANNGHYDLVSGDRIGHRTDEFAHAIHRATDGTYVHAETVCLGYPGTFALFLRSAWRKRLRRTRTAMADHFIRQTLRAWHGRDGYGEFIAACDDALWTDALSDTFGYMPTEVARIASDTVLAVLRLYLSYAVLDSPIGLKGLTPLVSVLPDAIPIGEPEEWPGTCLFLVA